MTGAGLTAELRRFVVAKFDSVPLLEALLLLRSREGGWSPQELAARLYLPESRVTGLLKTLVRERLAQHDDGVVMYAPRDAHVAAMVDELGATYSRHVVAVAELIHSSVERKARDFADAFKLRRDE